MAKVRSQMSKAPKGQLTDDAFLGGKLQILQPSHGYRAAIDAVCLAASVPAQLGERVLDVGFGVGVAGLCLAKRQNGIALTGLEIQPDLVEIAHQNIERNDIGNVDVVTGDIFSPPSILQHNSFDHVITNPPFYDEHKAISPPNQSKSVAHMHRGNGSIEKWIENAITFIKPKGSFTIVYPAESLDDLLSWLCGPLGNVTIFPLWPGNGKAAKRILLTGQKGASGPVKLLPGLRLHAPPRRYAPEAEAVLRDGGPIHMI
jgi:tRNA1(Val) A37 N6-methylase TrmN6